MPEDPSNVNVTSALPDDMRESAAVANLKTLGEAVSFLTAQMLGNAAAHATRMNVLAESELANSLSFGRNATGQAIKGVAESDLAEVLSQLGAAVANTQQTSKTAGNTPPVTP